MFVQRQEGVFTNLRQLRTLSVIHNLIASIEPRAFYESANMSSLSSIDLSDNSLTELEPWPIIRAQHRPMLVGLQSNRITNFTNALQWSFGRNSTRIFNTTVDLSKNNFKHITDVIRGWNIDGRLQRYAIILTICLSYAVTMTHDRSPVITNILNQLAFIPDDYHCLWIRQADLLCGPPP